MLWLFLIVKKASCLEKQQQQKQKNLFWVQMGSDTTEHV